MLRNLFGYVLTGSLFLHVGIFYLIEPVFDPGDTQTVLYSWGQFQEIDLLRLNEGLLVSDDTPGRTYQNFLLPLDKQIDTQLQKVSSRFSLLKSCPVYAIDKSFAKKPLPYVFCADKADSPVIIEFFTFIDKGISFAKPFSGNKIEVSLFISPSGRVIYAKKPSFYCDIFARFGLEDWAKNLVFQPQRTYYWKNIEIMIK